MCKHTSTSICELVCLGPAVRASSRVTAESDIVKHVPVILRNIVETIDEFLPLQEARATSRATSSLPSEDPYLLWPIF